MSNEISEVSLFPDPRGDFDQGLVAVGGNLNVQVLKDAYAKGIFPWPHEGYPMLWFCPDERAIIDQKNFHVPRSLMKWARQHHPEVRYNTCFAEVILQCQIQKRFEFKNGKRQEVKATWITEELKKAYIDLHNQQQAYSIEVFINEKLIGGLYGVHSRNYSTAESMFHTQTNGSKWALAHVFEYLNHKNQNWVDIQMLTPTSQMFGGQYIGKHEFLERVGL